MIVDEQFLDVMSHVLRVVRRWISLYISFGVVTLMLIFTMLPVTMLRCQVGRPCFMGSFIFCYDCITLNSDINLNTCSKEMFHCLSVTATRAEGSGCGSKLVVSVEIQLIVI